MTKGARLINFRPFLCIFVLIATTILFSLVAFYVFPLGLALLILLFAATVALAVRAAMLRDFFKVTVYAVAVSLCALAVFAFMHTALYRYELSESVSYVLSGRVTEHYSFSDGAYTATLDELTANGEKIDGRLSLTVEQITDKYFYPDCGDVVEWRSEISINELIDDGVNASSVRSDIRYYAYAQGSDVNSVRDGDPRTLEKLRLALRDKLTENMSGQTGEIAFGMIAGDRYMLSDEITDAFSSAGIGHILAVSGLHIGLVAMLCAYLLSKLRVPPAVRAAIVTAALLLYTVFTGGSPSAIRAFVMCVIALWARFFGLRDGLNCLCAAGVVCLTISPFYLFECGFLMSMGSVYGLITFSRPIFGLLSKTGMPKFIAKGLSASLAVQIAIIPLTAVFFSKVYIYSVIVNALLMPVLGAAYTFMLAILPFTFIPPFAPLILLPSAVLWAITALGAAVSALPFAAITVRYSVGAVAVLPASFFASRFVMRVRRWIKTAAFIALALILAVTCENSVRTDKGMIVIGGGATATVIIHGDVAYLIADFSVGSRVVNAISRSRLLCDTFIVCEQSLTQESAEGIIEFARSYNVTEAVFPLLTDTEGYKRLTDAGLNATAAADAETVFDVAYSSGSPCGWLFRNGGKTFYVTNGFADETAAAAADIVRAKACYVQTSATVYTAWECGYDYTAVTRGDYVLTEFS